MPCSWSDFNDALPVSDIIPDGTIAKVRLVIRRGRYNDPQRGWTGGYATLGREGAVYLNGEFTVLEGPYARRKIFSRIGLHSPNGPRWANMGRTFMREMLNSAHGFSDKDSSEQAMAARRINSFDDLNGLEFVARIDVGKNADGEERNEIRVALTPDHEGYAEIMGTVPVAATGLPQADAALPIPGTCPSWAR
jgi:hypothetical protein